MKKSIYLIVAVLLLTSMACSFTVNLPDVKTGPDVTYDITEKLPDGNPPTSVELNVGAAELKIYGGAKNLVDGTVITNVPDWEPEMLYSDDHLTISQKEKNISGIPSRNLNNKWDIAFNNNVPLDITINAGAYQGRLDLGGMNVTHLNISDGASDTRVEFTKPNAGSMESFEYNSGASNVELSGLANANLEKLDFTAGAGNYVLDFSGDLQKDMQVTMEVGVSAVKIVIPKGTQSEITVEGEMKDVNTTGTWTAASNTYSTAGDGPIITINVNMNLGSIELVQEK